MDAILKNPKTSILGFIGLVILITMVAALIMKKVDITDFAAVLAASGAFLGSINALVSEDGKGSIN